jgi:hypothetical protein
LLRNSIGFLLTALVISLTAGLGLVLSIWILEAPVDGWRPGELLGGALLISIFAAPLVLVGQLLLALPVLIMVRRSGFLASSAATVALGGILGFFASGFLNGLWLSSWPETFQVAQVGAVSGMAGGLIWWFLVERYFVRSSNV